MRLPLLLAGALSLQACGYDEGLVIENLHGKIHLPAEATVRDITDADGNLVTLPPDVRAIGPVYLGLYPAVLPAGSLEQYPYPEIGPQFKEGIPGDAYPYGGTQLGDIRFACLQSLACYTISGRYQSYDAMLEWFNLLQIPVLDSNGDAVTSGEFIRQTCFDLYNVNSDKEVRLLPEDADGNGKISPEELDFVLDEQANEWVGEFEIRQQEVFYDQSQENCTPGRDCHSMSLWGWVDTPALGSFNFRTCDSSEGFNLSQYNETYTGGRVFNDVLNFPTKYVEAGDLVVGEPYEWKDVYAEPDIYLDFQVQ